jgi:hypothetical protein
MSDILRFTINELRITINQQSIILRFSVFCQFECFLIKMKKTYREPDGALKKCLVDVFNERAYWCFGKTINQITNHKYRMPNTKYRLNNSITNLLQPPHKLLHKSGLLINKHIMRTVVIIH